MTYEKYYSGVNNIWSSWFDISLNTNYVFTISEPAAIWDTKSRLFWVFIRGTDNRIYLNKNNGTGWSEVQGGGLTVAGPSVVVENGVVKLFMTGTNEGIWENDFDGQGWVAVTGGAFTPSGPAAVDFFGGTAVYVRTEDGKIFECF